MFVADNLWRLYFNGWRNHAFLTAKDPAILYISADYYAKNVEKLAGFKILSESQNYKIIGK